MNARSTSFGSVALALAAFSFAGAAAAVPLLCNDPSLNHMSVDTSQVSECLGGGSGNINGNPRTDSFLATDGADSGLIGIGSGSFTQSGATGTFALDATLWGTWSEIAIGFKFGTGNRPDEWFVYLLNPLVASGSWEFTNVFGRGGGLSHINLYGRSPANSVPEPGTLALLGIGLLGAGIARRRKRL